jgi:hypothetical protein
MPWSLRILLFIVLASAGAFAWSKRPFVSDAEKICRVAELSGCPREGSILSNDCKIAWLERSMWHFGQLAQMPPAGDPDGGNFLRAWARRAGLNDCSEALTLDREFETLQRTEAAKNALLEPESKAARGDDADEAPPVRRVVGIVKAEAPSVEGEMDPALVSKEVLARIGAVRACYERALKRDPHLTGRLNARWTITSTGAVSNLDLTEDTVGDVDLLSCVESLIRRWRFVAPGSGLVAVSYPFVFQPGKEKAP